MRLFVEHASTTDSAVDAVNAEFLTHKTVNNTSLHNTAGTFAFSGTGDPWSGLDWVGLQVGDNVDKFQIVAKDNTLLVRQNDNGGTNATWSNWVTVLTSSNYNSYAPTLTGTGASGNWNINAATATKATQDGSGNTITSTYVKKVGDTMTGNLTVSNANPLLKLSATSNGSPAIELYRDGSSYSDWKIINNSGTLYIQNDYTTTVGDYFNVLTLAYNTGNATFKGSVTATAFNGNATSATKATQDGNGAVISSTYAKLSGAAFTGAVTGTSFAASSYLACNSNNYGNEGGLALWSTNPVNYGVLLRTTENMGKHGYVQGNYATYLTMTAADATNVPTRGWVFKNTYYNTGVASISCEGKAVFNGSVTVGGNAANTSGCRQEFDANLQCLNFIFN